HRWAFALPIWCGRRDLCRAASNRLKPPASRPEDNFSAIYGFGQSQLARAATPSAPWMLCAEAPVQTQGRPLVSVAGGRSLALHWATATAPYSKGLAAAKRLIVAGSTA